MTRLLNRSPVDSPAARSRSPGSDRQPYDGARRENVTVDDNDWLAERFEAQRAHLSAVAYRMLGSRTDADDAVQEAWLHLHRADTSDVENLGGWLTTVVARVCLDMLRARRSRPAPVADPVAADRADGPDPEDEA